MNVFFKMNKVAIYGFWLVFIVNLVISLPGQWSEIVMYAGLGLFVIHFIEYVFIHNKLKKADSATLKDFVQIMLIGLFHWVPLLRKH